MKDTTSPGAADHGTRAHSPQSPTHTRRQSWQVYLQANSFRMLCLGFAAGLPLLLVLGSLSFRLREAGIDRTTIGYLSWIGLAYGFKWVWAPVVDQLRLPLLHAWLGQRRSWLLLAQIGIALGLLGMAVNDPQHRLDALVACAVWVAFASATQDIALDAYRIELAPTDQQAALAACYQTGYRLAMIWSGAGVLWLAASQETAAAAVAAAPTTGMATPPLYQQNAWQWAYGVMAASMLLGALTVLLSPKPVEAPPSDAGQPRGAAQWLQHSLFDPFLDFWQRHRWQALLILALIASYRVSDVVMGIMANPFYVDMGYSKSEVASVSKVYGVITALLGAFVGGSLTLRWGVMRMLMLGAVLSASSNLLYVLLAQLDHASAHRVLGLIGVVSADNFSSGIASAAFIAYLSGLTNVRYSATQYALFSSIMLLLPKTLAGYSGWYVDHWGYESFFTATALLGLPVLLLLVRIHRIEQTAPAQATTPVANEAP